MGQAGNVILFVFLYVLLILISSALFTYAARCFLVVLEGTATGNDEVAWPDEPYLDWLWRGGTLAWLLLVWLAPLGAILKVISPDLWSQNPLLGIILAGGTLWLFFPVGVLSAVTAESRLAFFRPRILLRMVGQGSGLLVFYAATLVVILLALGGWSVALFRVPGLIPVASIVGAFCLILYARLLGRLAWMMTPGRRRKKPRGPTEASALVAAPTPTQATDPVPVVAGDEDEEESDPVSRPEASPPGQPRRVEGYELEEPPAEDPPEVQAQKMLAPLQRRVERAQSRLKRTGPPRSLWRGVWTFPFYETSRQAWVKLSILGILAGAVARQLLKSGL